MATINVIEKVIRSLENGEIPDERYMRMLCKDQMEAILSDEKHVKILECFDGFNAKIPTTINENSIITKLYNEDILKTKEILTLKEAIGIFGENATLKDIMDRGIKIECKIKAGDFK